MTRQELYKKRYEFFHDAWEYEFTFWDRFDYSILKYMMYRFRSGKGKKKSINDVIIMADTETSKKKPDVIGENHVCAWTISLRSYDMNFFTLWGTKPSDLMRCISKIHQNMPGETTIVYIHNLGYDYIFLRKFMFEAWGYPTSQLNTKPYYPIYVEFENGLIFKDSLILAQRKLEKWASDLEVEHQKAVGKWDYEKIRNQSDHDAEHPFSEDEGLYIENDTLAGVECLDATMNALNKWIGSIPYTATGIPREEVRKRGKEVNAHEAWLRQVLSLDEQIFIESVYHGGYVHGNRHFINELISCLVYGLDFASSYPFVMLSERYPAEKFHKVKDKTIEQILRCADKWAYMFRLVLVRPRLKSDDIAMPTLQYSKCIKVVNPILDNGRILACEYAEICLNEIDLEVIASQYTYSYAICQDVECAYKDYLPRWFTDYVFQCFEEKTKLKNIHDGNYDPVAYSMAKARLNSLYGMSVQKPIRENIEEDYESGEYRVAEFDAPAVYEKYLKNWNNVLNYQVGVWVTSYSFRNLHKLGACVADGCEWLYSDTDSCYATGWDWEAVSSYNNMCKEKLKANGYGCVYFNNREYWPGIAEHDPDEDVYTEFKYMGAKRYCGRQKADGKLHITVAGVPKKKGVLCLNDDINNFAPGFIFSGSKTGKTQHSQFFTDCIYIDDQENETGDSIDLSPCDYLLNAEGVVDWEELLTEEVSIQVYDEEE